MGVPAKGRGSDRGLGTGAPTNKAPQPTKRASMAPSNNKGADMTVKKMGKGG